MITGNRSAAARPISRGNRVNRPYRDDAGALFPLSRGFVSPQPVDAPDVEGTTALHLAIVRRLLAHGAVVNRPNNDGATALYGASQSGHGAVVQFLIAQGALPDTAIDTADIPLMTAEVSSEERAVRAIRDGTWMAMSPGWRGHLDGEVTWMARSPGWPEVTWMAMTPGWRCHLIGEAPWARQRRRGEDNIQHYHAPCARKACTIFVIS